MNTPSTHPDDGPSSGRLTDDGSSGSRLHDDGSSGGRLRDDGSSGGRLHDDGSSGGRLTGDRLSGGRLTGDRLSGGRVAAEGAEAVEGAEGAGKGGPSLLEERYRRVLRMLPADFRRDWADDMVATFLDRAYRSRPDDPEGVEISSPRWPEIASVAGQALRLRLGDGPGAPARAYVTGAALRQFALAGVLVHIALELSGLLLAIWWTTRLGGSETGFAHRWQAVAAMSGLLWIPVFVGLLYGRYRVAVILAGVALLPEVVTVVDRSVDGPFTAAWLLVAVAPVAAMVAFHRTAPPVRPRLWLIAVPVLTAVVTSAVLLLPMSYTVVDLLALGVALAGLVTLIVAPRQPAVLIAAALWCLFVLPLRFAALGGPAKVAELVALVMVGAAAGVTARWNQGRERADASA